MEWKINKSSNGCTICNKEFIEEEEYYSSLYNENDTFTRKDFCNSCWNGGKEEGFFSFWKTKVPKKDKPAQRFVNTEILLDMFMKLEGDIGTHQKNLRFVLALYLIRKKILKLRSLMRQNDEEYIIVHCSKIDREFYIFNPNLKEEEIEAITLEMSQLLNFPYIEHEGINSSTN